MIEDKYCRIYIFVNAPGHPDIDPFAGGVKIEDSFVIVKSTEYNILTIPGHRITSISLQDIDDSIN